MPAPNGAPQVNSSESQPLPRQPSPWPPQDEMLAKLKQDFASGAITEDQYWAAFYHRMNQLLPNWGERTRQLELEKQRETEARKADNLRQWEERHREWRTTLGKRGPARQEECYKSGGRKRFCMRFIHFKEGFPLVELMFPDKTKVGFEHTLSNGYPIEAISSELISSPFYIVPDERGIRYVVFPDLRYSFYSAQLSGQWNGDDLPPVGLW